MLWKKLIYSFLILCGVWGSPVLWAVSRAEEIRMGVEEFGPFVQEQGGADVIHDELSMYVNRVGKRVAAASDRPNLPFEFVVIDTTDINAWALSGGKIGIDLGLLLKLSSEAELASVLSHEIGHAVAGHTATQIEREAVLALLKTGIYGVLKNYWYAPLVDQGVDVGEALTLLRYTRQDELEADTLGVKFLFRAGYDVHAASDVEKMFLNLDPSKDDGWFATLFATHPPSKERLKAIRKEASKYASGGFQGAEEYERIIEPLRAKESAYCALDKGKAYLAKGKIEKALKEAQKGLSIEPNEPHLSLLEAQALLHLGRTPSALTSINRAIGINPNYYQYYLERALIFDQMGRFYEAQRDRAHAKSLLDTLDQ